MTSDMKIIGPYWKNNTHYICYWECRESWRNPPGFWEVTEKIIQNHPTPNPASTLALTACTLAPAPTPTGTLTLPPPPLTTSIVSITINAHKKDNIVVSAYSWQHFRAATYHPCGTMRAKKFHPMKAMRDHAGRGPLWSNPILDSKC